MAFDARALSKLRLYTDPQGELTANLSRKGLVELAHLAVLAQQTECLDLCGNSIHTFPPFPPMPYLRTIRAACNKIERASPGWAKLLPVLRVLILSDNNISSLEDLETFLVPSLRILAFDGCPVASVPGAVALCHAKCPSLHILNWGKAGTAKDVPPVVPETVVEEEVEEPAPKRVPLVDIF